MLSIKKCLIFLKSNYCVQLCSNQSEHENSQYNYESLYRDYPILPKQKQGLCINAQSCNSSDIENKG